ncbi:MAG: TIGR00730 family Rossman fold protein [Gemmatimonadetes bacterium]|nr:TIGR00730 family Rossman fold protein [Gemmatimonadota bacterium]
MPTPAVNICVYCGSKSPDDKRYQQAAVTLGKELVARQVGLIYGGGRAGLMGEIAQAVLDGGGHVTGVIPRDLMDRELGHTGVTELFVVDDMHQRKALMSRDAAAFIALPGGYGTLEELFEMVAWQQLEIHDRPVGILNTGGYYDGLFRFLDQAVETGFLHQPHRDLLIVEEEPEALLDKLLPQ